MSPEFKTALNSLIVAIGFALSPVNGAAQQTPVAQSQSPNIQQQNSNPRQTLAYQSGSVHAPLTRKTNVHGTSDRSSKPRYVPTGGGDKTAHANQLETTQSSIKGLANPAAGGGDKSIDAQGAVSLASPFLNMANSQSISDSQENINEFFTYLTTKLEKRVEEACYSSPASNEDDSSDQDNCRRQVHQFVIDPPLESTLLNDDSYEASLILDSCPTLVHDPAEQAPCFEEAIRDSQSLALLTVTASCQDSPTPNQCFTDNVSAIANEASTVGLNIHPIDQRK